ncbi:MAG: tRNA 4-thiouridine(8) synthase ThiI [Thermoplasmata archaeon]|nr:tRNA 4-thiouridine(8) synthase ThiI [Thermoplasmata archaeon]
MIIVRYGELGLKGKNRKFFEELLAKNIERKLRRYGYSSRTKILRGRIFVYASDEAAPLIAKCPGVTSVSPAKELEYEELPYYLSRILREYKPSSFKVEAQRLDKDFPRTSPEINREIGDFVVREFGWQVDLRNPELVIGIEIIKGKAYAFLERYPGVGGLPVGSSGRLITLISSGIDSPVAAYLMMRRGAEIIALHFKQSQYTEKKVREIMDVLSEYSPQEISLEVIDHKTVLENYAQKLKEMGKERWICIFCKYSMIKMADEMAKKKNALGIVTGDSLGQVASQTLENLYIESTATHYPIYRPLIGMDKVEIEKIARDIGTYHVFVSSPEEKCPFRPRYVITQGDPKKFQEILKKVND